MTSRRTAAASLFLLGLTVLFFHETLLTGLSYFAGDLTYYWLPRKTFAAQSLQAGTFPLWNPYFRCGLPFFANPDHGVLDALALPFYLLPFGIALKFFQATSIFLTALAFFLFARARRLPFSSALFFACVLAFCGYALIRVQFLSQCSALLWGAWSAFFLLSGAVVPAGAALALSVFSGHWQTLAVFGAAVMCLWIAFRPRGEWNILVQALLIAVALSAIQWVPSLEALAQSSWGADGLSLSQSTVYALRWRDLARLGWPLRQDPWANLDNLHWVRFIHIGIIPLFLAAIGWITIKLQTKQRSVAFILFFTGLSLGGLQPVTDIFYRYIRYPGRWMWGAVLALGWLAALGFKSLPVRTRGAFFGLALLQLWLAWRGSLPVLPVSYFQGKGRLAAYLQRNTGEPNRYLLSFKTERLLSGEGDRARDRAENMRDRLYVESALSFRLNNAGGYGEPLTPKNFDGFLDFIASRPSPEAALAPLSRAGVRTLLSADPWDSPFLDKEGILLWRLYRNPRALPRAYWISNEEYAATQSWDAWRGNVQPVDARYEAEKIRLVGNSNGKQGLAVLSDPWFPGWRAYVNGSKSVMERDSGLFRAVRVPEKFEVLFLYRPWTFMAGLWITVAALAALAWLGLKVRGLRGT